MPRHKRQSYLTMERDGFWWMGGKWVPDGTQIPPGVMASSNRRFRTKKALVGAFDATPAPCYIEARYRGAGRYGKGWLTRWFAEKVTPDVR